MLHLKYKVLLSEQKIEFNNFAGGKALATDHFKEIEGGGLIIRLSVVGDDNKETERARDKMRGT